jgi:hypothetical protein
MKNDRGIFRITNEHGQPVHESTSLTETIAWLRQVDAALYKVSFAIGISADILPGHRFLDKFDAERPHG